MAVERGEIIGAEDEDGGEEEVSIGEMLRDDSTLSTT
jgi:hypothetical protein